MSPDPKRMRAVFGATQADGINPFVHEPGILSRAEVDRTVDTAWEGVVLSVATPTFEPRQQARPHIACNLELNGTTGLLLDNDRASSYLRSRNHIANPDLDQITAAKLAVDCQIEQGAVPNASLAIEEEADCPDLLLGERTLGVIFHGMRTLFKG